MRIKEIKWLDKEGKEAILKVVSEKECLMCFSCPCSHNIGDVLSRPLECLDTDDIVLCDTKENSIEKTKGVFEYKLKGKLMNMQEGIVEVCGFDLHIDEEKIPRDIANGMYIQFLTSRIDIW